MRITTNALLRNYKSNLSASISNLDSARTKVMTQRKFNSTKEDPSSALRAAVLERKYVRNQDYLSMVKDVHSFQNSQEDAAMQINTISQNLSKKYGLEALNGTNGSLETRQTYAAAWRGAQESLVLCLNSSYEGRYVFAGNDGKEAPFKLTTDADGNQTLTYRGVDVNVPANQDILDQMSRDSKDYINSTYIDLGFGLNIDAGNIIDSSSAFDTSLPGIDVVGYGLDDNGISKNMVLLAGQIADVLDDEVFDEAKYKQLLNAFDGIGENGLSLNQGRNRVLEKITNLGTQSEFLTTTEDRLDSNRISLSEQIDNVVNVDMAEAIMNFSWAQYAYNAALKVGNNILTPSFIDFMS
ncbi:MAG TPA: hypothetical protein DF613_08130 [Lachnospiraceae bacterium]|nr:hypothetical protein [Lachnospiraceae bacterium]